ncbi:MAG: hypothetical protein GF390_01930 [Candidatus Pacebacteria bacterium]|nr:hypothetical protein [Candidatus Paceibacterota bacterium]
MVRKLRNLKHTLAHLFHPRRSNKHRARLLHPEALAYLAVLVVGFFALVKILAYSPLSTTHILGFASNITAEQVVNLTNQERQELGLSELVLNPQLTQAALAKAQHMFNNQYWSHVAPDGRQPWDFIKDNGYVYKVAGENLARDFSTTPAMIEAWMASPTHRANIVNPKYQEIGIAVVDGELEGFETTLVVQLFGTQQDLTVSRITDQAQHQPGTVAVQPQFLDQQDRAAVLASINLPVKEFQAPPLFTPLQLTKAFFLSVIILILVTLAYDALIMGHRKTMRLVGKNLAHIFLFIMVAFLVIFFKGGVVQ